MSADNFLQVSPQELKFRFELRKNIPVALTLQNTTGERVAFKVKTTSPKKYCVRPSNGIVEPHATREVQVIMQAQKEYPPSFTDCKDKFLIQSVKVAGGTDVREVTPDLFDPARAKDVRQIKLRVQLQAPPKPPSPVPEGNEEPASPAQTTQFRDTTEGRTAVSSAAAEKAEIKKRLDMLEGHSQGGQQHVASAATKARPPATGFTLYHLLLVAILAFVLGHVTSVTIPVLTKLLKGAA